MLVGTFSRCLLLLFVVVWDVDVFGGGMNGDGVVPSFCPISDGSGSREEGFSVVFKRSRKVV